MQSIKTTTQIFTIQEISQHIKLMLEQNLDNIRVIGELVLIKKHASGNIYFTLKDKNTSLDCIVWKSIPINLLLIEGMQIICSGKISSYPGRSKYQMLVRHIELSGIGDTLIKIEHLKQKLVEEGLFLEINKPKLPKFPQKIGIITSSTGAVIHDMIHRLQDRYPCDVLFYDAIVQGPMAPKDITNGLQNMQNKVDIIIIARGGGSFEDLLCFYDEDLVRTIVKSKTPVVTAVGHETDTTLVDYAASLRAPTPTAAIELITPDRKELLIKVHQLTEQANHAVASLTRYKQETIDAFNIHLDNSLYCQELDYTTMDLDRTYKAALSRYSTFLAQEVYKPILDQQNTTLNALNMVYKHGFEYQYKKWTNSVEHWVDYFDMLSHKNTLKRGYCLSEDKKFIIQSIKDAKNTKKFNLHFHDGIVHVKIV